jgi:hypothetical protein
MARGFEPLRAYPCRIGPFRCLTLKADWELERAAALFGLVVERIWLIGASLAGLQKKAVSSVYQARHSQARIYVNAALRLILCFIMPYTTQPFPLWT